MTFQSGHTHGHGTPLLALCDQEMTFKNDSSTLRFTDLFFYKRDVIFGYEFPPLPKSIYTY